MQIQQEGAMDRSRWTKRIKDSYTSIGQWGLSQQKGTKEVDLTQQTKAGEMGLPQQVVREND